MIRDSSRYTRCLQTRQKVVAELRKLSSQAKTVWIASDEDREGEAIAWHLVAVLGLDPSVTRRIVFHEITKDAITNAVKSPRQVDMNLVNAQQARRILDRLVGFEISPVLWKKVQPSLSPAESSLWLSDCWLTVNVR